MDTLTPRQYVSGQTSVRTGATGAMLDAGASGTPPDGGFNGKNAGKEVRTVKFDCPEDRAQTRRDHFLAFQVRNRGNPVRYNIKLQQEGSACYTPYRLVYK